MEKTNPINTLTVDLSKLISPRFYGVVFKIMAMEFQDYYFNGGRSSTKSSMISVILIIMLMEDPKANAVVLRQVANTLRDSVISQLEWAIYELNVEHDFKVSKSTHEITRISTGQKILFRGADDPQKLKSLKVAKGYIKIIWFEELAEFKGVEGLRSIKQSLARGSQRQVYLHSYNPPRSKKNWANVYVEQEDGKKEVLVHRSTYLTVPKAWLNEKFIRDAEYLKKTNPRAYQHEYLGKQVGSGSEVFPNVIKAKISDEMVKSFDKVHRGIDWGYVDPFAYVEVYYNKAKRSIYFLNEFYGSGYSNRTTIKAIKDFNKLNEWITADSADPGSIAEFRAAGLKIRGARKGAGSVDRGVKWLQDLEAIVIDPERTPNVYREFNEYELEKDKTGNLIEEYPDANNHAIDCTRYALERAMLTHRKEW